MTDTDTNTARTLGHWYRFNPARRALHVCRWEQTEDGRLVIRAACGGLVVEPTADEPPAGLAIPKTAHEALATIQPEQRRMLCKACASLLGVS